MGKTKKQARPYDFARRSRAAKKGWRTRRLKHQGIVFARRSRAAKKGWRTRRLKHQGIVETRRIGPTGYEYSLFELPVLDSGLVGDIVQLVRRRTKRNFDFHGLVRFRTPSGEEFSNATDGFSPAEWRTASIELVRQIQSIILAPSPPRGVERSPDTDVEGTLVQIRYGRRRGKGR